MERLLCCLFGLATLFVALQALEVDQPDHTVCKKPQLFRGCSMDDGECVCGKREACTNPYPYRSQHECEQEKKGLNDKCRRHPCVHGECVQTKRPDGRRHWHCQCAGSGFHGHRCQRPCPKIRNPLPAKYPSACVY